MQLWLLLLGVITFAGGGKCWQFWSRINNWPGNCKSTFFTNINIEDQRRRKKSNIIFVPELVRYWELDAIWVITCSKMRNDIHRGLRLHLQNVSWPCQTWLLNVKWVLILQVSLFPKNQTRCSLSAHTVQSWVYGFLLCVLNTTSKAGEKKTKKNSTIQTLLHFTKIKKWTQRWHKWKFNFS